MAAKGGGEGLEMVLRAHAKTLLQLFKVGKSGEPIHWV